MTPILGRCHFCESPALGVVSRIPLCETHLEGVGYGVIRVPKFSDLRETEPADQPTIAWNIKTIRHSVNLSRYITASSDLPDALFLRSIGIAP